MHLKGFCHFTFDLKRVFKDLGSGTFDLQRYGDNSIGKTFELQRFHLRAVLLQRKDAFLVIYERNHMALSDA